MYTRFFKRVTFLTRDSSVSFNLISNLISFLFINGLLVLFVILNFGRVPKVYAYSSIIYRQTKYQFYINKTNPKNTKVQVERTVKLLSTSLELPKNNKEYFNVCPADGRTQTLEKIKKTIVAYGERNNKISFSVQVSGSCLLVSVPYEHAVYGYRPYKIKISYIDPSVALKRGGVLEISYPRLKDKPVLQTTKNYGRSQIQIKHDIYVQFMLPPNDLKKAHVYVAGGKVQPIKPDVFKYQNYAVMSYNINDIWKTGIYILLGDVRYIKFSVYVPKSQDGILSDLDKVVGFKQVVLPRSDRQTGQMVYYTKITPDPIDVTISETGNLIATFPGGQDIEIQGYASITHKNIDLGAIKKIRLEDYEVNKYLQDYIKPAYPYWPSDNPEILSIATSLKQDNLLDTIVKDVEFVISNIKYNEKIDFSKLSRKGAIRALHEGSGVCMEYADLLLSILRAQGIASRAGLGNVLTRFVDTSYTNVGHQWVEVYIPSYGWVIVDPTLSDDTSIVINQNLNYFTYVNAQNINDLTQLKCFSWAKACSDIQLKVDFVDSIPKEVPLKQEVDLLVKNRNIINTSRFNTFIALDKISKFENKLNTYVFAGKLPDLNVTSLYVILFVILYFIVYLITHIIRAVIKYVLKKMYCKKMHQMAPHCNRIVQTISVTTPVTSVLDDEDNSKKDNL